MKEEFLHKAEENLKIAQISFELECYNASANRAYFAAFQAAIAALADKGVLSKGRNDHKWVQSEFNLRLIKREKLYPSDFKKYLFDMQSVRNLADYSDQNIGKKIACKQLERATELIHHIETEVRK